MSTNISMRVADEPHVDCRMNSIRGSCHCDNIRYQFIWPDFDPESGATLPVRSCTCTFCIKHGGVYTSHPEGMLTVQIVDESLVQWYEFGTQTAKFYICRQCGVFSFVTSMIDGNVYAVVNVNTFDNVDHVELSPTLTDFDGECVEARLVRRQETWISNVEITESFMMTTHQ